jgi:hypothetical protein
LRRSTWSDHRPARAITFAEVRNGKWEFTGEYASIETTKDAPRDICPLFEEIVGTATKLELPNIE